MDVKWLLSKLKKAGLLALITGGAELATDYVKHRSEKNEEVDEANDEVTDKTNEETEKVPSEDVTVEEETES